MAEGTSETFTWLHITDLHVGLTDQDWLWPTFKQAFFDDISRMLDTTKEADLVIFSGDLTQSGSPDQFAKFGEIVSEIWQVFKSRDVAPKLLVIPGNHDVTRTEKLTPELLLLKNWWNFPAVQEDFFVENSNYRTAVETVFAKYDEWAAACKILDNTIGGLRGWLPGDQSIVLKKGSLRVGVVGLNSTWLQLDGDDYLGRLHVDVRQLNRVTEDDPSRWCSQNHLNLLVTHHPVEWLHPDSREYWNSDIYLPQRFAAHLFGHMHTPLTDQVSRGGSKPRRSIQGASLFGMRKLANGLDRIHGYSVSQFSKYTDREQIKVWPRILTRVESGERKLTRNQHAELDEKDGSYTLLDRPVSQSSVSAPTENKSNNALQVLSVDDSAAILRRARYRLPTPHWHVNVRRVEQQSCLEALSKTRLIWIIADWGMGEDGFLASVRLARGEQSQPIYKLDLSDYSDRDQLYEIIRRRLRCSLDQFTDLLSDEGSNYLIFDNVPSSSHQEASHSPEADLEEVASIMLEYCPGLKVIMRGRRHPGTRGATVVQLTELDEADLKAYVEVHEKGGIELATPDTVAALHRHTDGIPLRVDQALKQLTVITLTELLNSNDDVTMSRELSRRADPNLALAVREFAQSDDSNQQRSFSLLKVLSIFPQGERLARVKRFLNNAPFFPAHATELFDAGFLEVSISERLDAAGVDQAKTLVVPRGIRECVRELVTVDELRELNRRAADLFFGPDWSQGIFKPPSSYRFDNPHCPAGDIANANALIIRLYNDAAAQDNTRSMQRSLGLALSYVTALDNGDHYQSVVNLCEQLLPNIADDASLAEHAAKIKVPYGVCLRMLGAIERAIGVLSEVEEFPLPSNNRLSILLSLSLAHQSARHEQEARDYARKVVAIDRHSFASLQAQTVLIQLEPDSPRKFERLAAHEAKCRRQKAFTAANSIALTRANSAESPEQKRKILEPVMVLSRDAKDHYNQTRAIVELSKVALGEGRPLSDKEMSQLINAYHFLFNERIAPVFDKCHDALWQGFEMSGDGENLLNLFRHSSLYWRLRGNTPRELRYIKALVDNAAVSARASTRAASYFRVRAVAAGVLPPPVQRHIADGSGQ